MVNSVAEPINSAFPSGPGRWIIAGVVLIIVAGGLVWWFGSDAQSSEQELAAKAELSTLGALVSMDSQRKHVHSVSLATLKSPDTIDRAIALLPALGHLQSLDVAGTAFRDEHAQTVGQLENLQTLNLNNTAITDAGLEKLHGLSELYTIYLVDTPVTNAGIPALGQLEALKIVDLSGTKVTGNLQPLRNLSNLEHLLVQSLTLDAASFDAIGQCPALSRLTLKEATYPQEALNLLVQKKPGLAIDR